MIRCFRLLPLLALCIGLSAHAADQNRRVGVGTGCTDANLASAFNAIRAQTGTHTIRINKGNYALPDGLTYLPSVNQTAVFLEGGYDNCTAPTPTGSTASDANLAVFSGAGGTAFPVLDLILNGFVQTFQMRRIVLTGGEDSGLFVTGQASVLLGTGAKIRGNSRATHGGGVVLNGSRTNDLTTLARIDFYLDEGAEITNNTAMNRGGGIFCGNGGGTDTHASIVFRDGIIGYNQADEGAAFYCRGSLEGGGGFQPRPRNDRAALIIGNQSTANGGGVRCAAGFGTLDTALPIQPDGFRHVGADADGNGLLAVAANGGAGSPALCLVGSRSRGATGDPAPSGQSRFLLRNLNVSSQTGNGFVGLSARDALELIVSPSGDNVSCTFFTATPCVRFTDNSVDGGAGQLLHASGGSTMLQLRRAMIDGNSLGSELGMADDGADLILLASILDDNIVAARTTAPSTSALFTARYGGVADLRNSTVIMRSALTQFFRLGWQPFGTTSDIHGIAYAQASAFSSTVGTPRVVEYESGTPTANFRRYWCGYFVNTTTNFSGHTIVTNAATGTYNLAANFSVDANHSPTHADLRDACTTPGGTLNRDFYGRPYSVDFPPANTLQADIGAVEAQLQDGIFSNGFET
ncbi:MAG TPA: hypothetical protein PLB00_10090 [Pseudomonadota bacterium]|nr:hypothetical protein [Pseudomonadota bacterium]